MDSKETNLKKLYLKYLFPSLFSGLVMSIYSLVDMIVVGQYEGSNGTAALACIAPFWTFFCCLSVLFGNGGAVLFSIAKGEGNKKDEKSAFTISFVLICVITAIVWLIIFLFDAQLLRLFGADETLMPLALRYMKWLKLGVPLWPIGYFLAMFVRNDGSPLLAGTATIAGGVLNVFGDFFLTFTCDLGIEGAGIATVVGQGIAFLILLTHFISKKNTVSFTRMTDFWRKSKEIISIGFSSFICSVSMGFMMILFNNQIVAYFGNNELAIYGIAGNIFTLIQTFSYGIGNAAQPIVAESLGAKQTDQVKQVRKMGSITAIIIGFLVMLITMLIPMQIAKLYLGNSEQIIASTPFILRSYFTCLLFVPFNVFATYYLQAIRRVKESVCISVLRGFFLSGAFVYLFPAIWGANAIWFAMLGAEMVTMLLAVWMFKIKNFKNDTKLY